MIRKKLWMRGISILMAAGRWRFGGGSVLPQGALIREE